MLNNPVGRDRDVIAHEGDRNMSRKSTVLAGSLFVLGFLWAGSADAQTCYGKPYPTVCPTTSSDTNNIFYWLRQPTSGVPCQSCHSNDTNYFGTAFNMNYLEQCIWSSFYAPGLPKAYTAYYRASDGSMPPGSSGGGASAGLTQTLYCFYFYSLSSLGNPWGAQKDSGKRDLNNNVEWTCAY